MKNYRKLLLLLGDLALLIMAFFVTVFIKGSLSFPASLIHEMAIPFIIPAAACAIGLYAVDLYDFRFIRPIAANLWRIAVVMIASPAISIILFYTFNLFGVAPKLTLVAFFLSFGVLFIFWRRLFYKIFSNSFKNKTVVWGTSAAAEHLFTEMAHNPHRGYEPMLHVRELPDLILAIENKNFTILVIDDALELPDELIDIVFAKKITVLSLAETYEDILQKVPLETVNETLFIKNIQHHRGTLIIAYRILDYLFAIPVLIASSPILIIVAIAIKCEDGGSIFYKHSRLGLLGKEFMLYKFRSMTQSSGDKFGEWAVKNDARITRVGKIIRKLHIDEIPQMINILRGDITLVGPRPDAAAFGIGLKEQIPHYHLRSIVKPGFTGWAQIKYRAGASVDDFTDRFQYDLYYIKHKEVFFDLGILLRTFQIIFSHTL